LELFTHAIHDIKLTSQLINIGAVFKASNSVLKNVKQPNDIITNQKTEQHDPFSIQGMTIYTQTHVQIHMYAVVTSTSVVESV
jgi:hypothetical protein